MSQRLPLRLLGCIEPGTWNIEGLSLRSKVGSTLLKESLLTLASLGVGSLSGGTVTFTKGDKLRASLLYLKHGVDVEEVSSQLDWRAFEGLAGEVLSAHRFSIHYNFRLRKSRREIDVLGLKEDFGVAIDCKHWSRTIGAAALRKAADAQISRVKALLTYDYSEICLASVVPVILTLRSEAVKIVRRVPVAPVASFSSFLLELEGARPFLEVLP